MELEDQEQEINLEQEPFFSQTGGAVDSVNGKTGDVVLTTSDLENDSDYQTAVEVSNAINTAIGEIDIPTVNDAVLTITQNGTSKGTFTANDDENTTIELADTTYLDFVGTSGTSAGSAGLVPAPATTDAGKFLKADGTWATAGGGGGDVIKTLTTADYNWNYNESTTTNPNSIALWLLPRGFYSAAGLTDSNQIRYIKGSSSTSTLSGIPEFVGIFPDSAGIRRMFIIIGNNTKFAATNSDGSQASALREYLDANDLKNNLTTSGAGYALDARQGKVLAPTTGSSDPTTSTSGTVGKFYINTSTGNAFICVAAASGNYTWKQITS